MNQSLILSIAKDFSREPAGRYVADGATSGEVFREKHLIPALRKSEAVTVLMDGTEGYGSSFLEEAFGGLVRRLGLTVDDFQRRLILVSNDDPSLIDEVLEYVRDESVRRSSH